MTIEFKIIQVNKRRCARGESFCVKVEVFENKESDGRYWMDVNTIIKHMEEYGKDTFINTSDFKDELSFIGLDVSLSVFKGK